MHFNIKSFLLFIISFLLIILLFELVNGFWFSSKLEKELLKINALYNINIEIDPNDYYESNKKIAYTRNQFGFRDNCDGPNKIDMISIGGSTTDQRYIDFENTFQKKLQNRLEESKINLCISNAGVDGHTSLGHVLSLENWFPLIENFKPKYYFLYIGINDAVFIGQNNQQKDEKNNFLAYLKFKIKQNSYLYWFYNKFKNYFMQYDNKFGILAHKKNIKNFYEYSSQKTNKHFENDLIKNSLQFRKNFSKILESIKDSKSNAICLTQPHRFLKNNLGIKNAFKYNERYLNGKDLDFSLQLINQHIKELCQKNNAIFLDTGDLNFEEDDFYDFVHLNNKGNAKLADFLYINLVNKLKIDHNNLLKNSKKLRIKQLLENE